jgi:hypothetical protein
MIKIILLSFHAFKEVQEISHTPPNIRHDLKGKGKGKQKALDQSSLIEIFLRKSRKPNYKYLKIMALVKTKHEEHLKMLDVVDSCDQFELTMVKWKKISRTMMVVRFSCRCKNGHICKDKLDIVLGD